MSATLGGSVKAHLESRGLGLSVFRTRAPAGRALPYVLVREAVAVTTELAGDFGSGVVEVREQVQVELVQQTKDTRTGANLERYGLASAVHRALHGAAFPPVLDGQCYPARVVGAARLGPDVDGPTANLTRDVFTVEVLRTLPSTVLTP